MSTTQQADAVEKITARMSKSTAYANSMPSSALGALIYVGQVLGRFEAEGGPEAELEIKFTVSPQGAADRTWYVEHEIVPIQWES